MPNKIKAKANSFIALTLCLAQSFKSLERENDLLSLLSKLLGTETLESVILMLLSDEFLAWFILGKC